MMAKTCYSSVAAFVRKNLAQLITSMRQRPTQNFMKIHPRGEGTSGQIDEIYACKGSIDVVSGKSVPFEVRKIKFNIQLIICPVAIAQHGGTEMKLLSVTLSFCPVCTNLYGRNFDLIFMKLCTVIRGPKKSSV